MTPAPATYQPDRTKLLEFTQSFKPFNTGAARTQQTKHDALPGFDMNLFIELSSTH